jgi:hypothetical protein
MAVSSFDYSSFQQLYALSSLSNAIGDLTGTEAALQSAMESLVDEFLPQINGKAWDLTWGPRVYKNDPKNSTTGPDNVWFATADDSQKVVVVSIAGTAPCSWEDWLQDLDITSAVDFVDWSTSWSASGVITPPSNYPCSDTSKSCIAEGTADGVFNVLNGTDPVLHPGRNYQHVYEYLSSVPKDYTVVFAGHSLGGALAPTTALGLVWSGLVSNLKSQAKVLASAGPTPGNAQFVADFISVFPASGSSTGYDVYNRDYYNINDIVPQVWSIDNSTDPNRYIDNIAGVLDGIYTLLNVDDGDAYGAIVGGTAAARTLAHEAPVSYVNMLGQPFTGPEIPWIDSVEALVEQIVVQHTTYYWQQIGINAFVQAVTKAAGSLPGVGTAICSIF